MPISSKKQSRPKRSRYDLEILGSLRRIIQSFDVHSRHLSTTASVTLPQLLCLFAVVEDGPIVGRDIARKIHVGTSTLVGVLDRLEAKDLIERVRDTRDRRRIFVVPTESGRRLISAAPSPLGEAFDRSFRRLSPAEQRDLATPLAHLADLMQVESSVDTS